MDVELRIKEHNTKIIDDTKKANELRKKLAEVEVTERMNSF